MQIQTTLRYHLIAIRMATINQANTRTENDMLVRCGEMRIFVQSKWEYKVVQLL